MQHPQKFGFGQTLVQPLRGPIRDLVVEQESKRVAAPISRMFSGRRGLRA